ncbi:MAG: STAS domain-containing protein [Roseivirga sp.]|nr:STAS domain-containing protein [Roseivirga sp.]
MKFSVDKQDKYTLLTLGEEKLDSTISPELKSEFVNLQTTGVTSLILNLSATKYADSSGLSALLTGNRTFSENGGSFVLAAISPFVEKLLTISQLNNVLNIVPTNEEAVDLVFMNDLERGFEEAGEE